MAFRGFLHICKYVFMLSFQFFSCLTQLNERLIIMRVFVSQVRIT